MNDKKDLLFYDAAATTAIAGIIHLVLGIPSNNPNSQILFVVDVPIDKVWSFYTDLHHLEVITPKRLDFKIIESSSNKITQGQTAHFSSKLLTRMTWKTTITTCKPYTYVDEMSNTIFKRWKHTHVFDKISENQTKVTDEIEFELQYGFIGKMFEWYAVDKLKKIFAHRQQATINALSNI